MTPILNPIPEDYRHLTTEFYAETEEAFRAITRIIGGLYGLSLIIFALTAHDPYQQIPILLILDMINGSVALCWLFLSTRLYRRTSVYNLLLIGLFITATANAIESLILDHYMSLFLASLAISLINVTLPWPPVRSLWLHIFLFALGTTMILYWEPSMVGPLVTIILAGIFSVGTQALTAHQRWRAYFNRRMVATLNVDLQAANDQLHQHNSRLSWKREQPIGMWIAQCCLSLCSITVKRSARPCS